MWSSFQSSTIEQQLVLYVFLNEIKEVKCALRLRLDLTPESPQIIQKNNICHLLLYQCSNSSLERLEDFSLTSRILIESNRLYFLILKSPNTSLFHFFLSFP
uniref:Uncharacterized protein n=1 Tax=Opuntia streptacantha TaxID=393608 RepID=A0A7C8ZWN3_OPUST